MKFWLSLWVLLGIFHAFGQSDYERAVRLFEEADSIRILEDTKHKQGRDKMNLYMAANKFIQAKTLFVAMDSSYFGFRSEVGLLKCQYMTGDLAIKKVKEIRDRLIEAEVKDSLLGYVYYHEGVALKNAYLFEDARNSLHRAISIFERERCIKEVVNSLWFLGLVYERESKDLYYTYHIKALNRLKRLPIGNYRVRSEYLINRNTLKYYVLKGEISKFWEVFFHCKDILKKYPEAFSEEDNARIYIEASKQLRDIGLYDKSLEFCQEARKHLELEWSIGLSEGLTLAAQRDFSASSSIYLILLKTELSLRRKAILFNNIGSNYYHDGKLQLAKNYLDSALILNEILKYSKGITINTTNLAEISMKFGRINETRKYLDYAHRFFPRYRSAIDNIRSQYFYKIRNLDSAFFYAKRSLSNDQGEIAFDANIPGALEVFSNRTSWLFQLIQKLIETDERDLEIDFIDLYSDFHYFLNRYDEWNSDLNFIESSISIYEQGIRHSLLFAKTTDSIKYLNKAFQFSEWSKVHSLQRAKKSSQAKFLAGLPEYIVDKERRLKIDENYFRSQLSQQQSLDSPDSSRIEGYRNQLTKTEESQDSLENVIRINYPRYHQLRYQDITLSVEEVQERLKPTQAFVEYYEGDTTSFVFTITKDDYQVERIHLDDDTLITPYREYFEPENFSPDQSAVNELSHRIYQNYLQPAIQHLDPSIEELIVVPDGKLSYVPFDILLTEPVAGQDSDEIPYLLRKYQVHYTYSASLYFNDFSTLSTKNEYLAFAPEYVATLSDTSTISLLGNFRSQVTPLKHNQEEVAYISRNFKGLGYFGTSANERNFKENVDEYGLLHLAMHTIVDDEDPMNSKLVFTNSNDSLEDDMLHAFEIYNMEIPSQLAVLSACETGFGQLAKGEGALSLARAFSYAGSPSVVMSHWPVDDQTTASLMKSFYDYLALGYVKSDALRRAKLDFLDQTHSARMHPYFWGSFVVMGDDSPVKIKRLPQANPMLVLLLCLTVLGLFALFLVRYEL